MIVGKCVESNQGIIPIISRTISKEASTNLFANTLVIFSRLDSVDEPEDPEKLGFAGIDVRLGGVWYG
jgi:hypothetical protein